MKLTGSGPATGVDSEDTVGQARVGIGKVSTFEGPWPRQAEGFAV